MPVAFKILLGFLLAALFVGPAAMAADPNADSGAQGTASSNTTDSAFDAAFQDEFDKDFCGLEGCDKLVSDPFEKINRGVFWVNDKLYFYLLKPVARGYRFVAPRPARSAVGRFFTNLSTPIRAGNALLQLKFANFSSEVYRFIVNSTIGLGGFFDPANALTGLKVKDEDFGQTMGYYGIGEGFYLVLPVIGPSTLRDASGSVVDTFLDPMKYIDRGDVSYQGVQIFKAINSLSLDPDTYEGVIRDALDPYLFIRAAYIQRRTAAIGKNEYNINMNIFDGSDYDFDLMNPLRWMGY